MAKSILDIEVNDQSFKQFNALFQQYQRQLKSTPLQWRNIALAQQQGVKGFRDLVLEQAAAIGQQRLLNEAHKAALNLLRQEESIWVRMRRETVGVASNIREVTGQLMKWGSLTAVFSGLLGAGGLFGISRLAEGVAGGRRSALGLGTTYGQQRAFGTAFGRFVSDPNSVLAGVEGALTDVTRRGALYGAGLTEQDLGGGSAAVASRLLGRLQGLAKSTPEHLLGNVFAARRIGELGITEDDFRALRRYSAGELAAQQGQFGQLGSAYGIGARDQRAYQDFVTALNDAGNRIEMVFVRGLAPLIPGMEGLSKSIVKSIENLTKGIPPDAMDRIGKGIERFSQYIGSEDFQENVKKFAAGIAWIAGKVVAVGAWVGDQAAPNPNTILNLGPLGTVDKPHIEGGLLGAARDIWNRGFGTGTLPLKEGAGYVDPGLAALAARLRGNVAGIKEFTAFNDAYHKGTGSAHEQNRAFDLTIDNPARSAEIADLIRTELVKAGIQGTVIDEYKNPSSRATAGHLHVQTSVRVENAAGSNIIVSARQTSVTP